LQFHDVLLRISNQITFETIQNRDSSEIEEGISARDTICISNTTDLGRPGPAVLQSFSGAGDGFIAVTF
jgi:hypothetical protein